MSEAIVVPTLPKPHRGRLLLTAVGTMIWGMTQNGPDEAEVNFCKWPRKIFPSMSPDCLHGFPVELLLVIAFGLMAGGIIWYLWPRIRNGELRHLMLTGLAIAWIVLTAVFGIAIFQKFGGKLSTGTSTGSSQDNAKVPLVWEDHIGHTYSGPPGALITHAIQISAKNDSDREIKLADAFINSDDLAIRFQCKSPKAQTGLSHKKQKQFVLMA